MKRAAFKMKLKVGYEEEYKKKGPIQKESSCFLCIPAQKKQKSLGTW